MEDLTAEQWLRANPNGDADFNADRNKAIIERTIKKTDKLIAKKKAAYKELVDERTDAVASYLTAITKGKISGSDPQKNILKYFGRRNLAYLRGEHIRDEIRDELMRGREILKD